MQAKPSEGGLPVGITMGDAAGIGPEIIVRMAALPLPCPIVVYGDAGILRRTLNNLGLSGQLDLALVEHPRDATGGPACIPVLNRTQALPADLKAGQIDGRAGRAAYEYLCHAIDDALAGDIRAIVTAPLHKQAMKLGGLDYPGHTEILAQRTGSPNFAMMMCNPELRVLLASIHIPLSAVAQSLTFESQLTHIRLAHQACRRAGIARPRIAVAGLNPHAGEEGRFGQEEITIIGPAIEQARKEGLQVTGPWPGDTVFMRARQGEFDIVVAQYHDQGLIPVKYLGLDDGVNITVGLPFVRTSVDHGTAFDIAGKGLARPDSLLAALNMAVQMSACTDGSR